MNTVLRYGTLIFILNTLFVLVLYTLGFHNEKIEHSQAISWLMFLIPSVLTFLGIKEIRDKENGGYLSYGRCFKPGFLMVLISSIPYSLFIYVYYTIINPESLEAITLLQEQNLLDAGVSEDQIESMMEMTKLFMTPTVMTGSSLLMSIIIGLIIVLIVAAILKKDEPMFSEIDG